MALKKMPTATWMVMDASFERWNVVSAHVSQQDAETERDKRNEGLSRRRYSACIAFEPIAERMGRPCR